MTIDLNAIANGPNEAACGMCGGRGFYGIPGGSCSFCKGTGRVKWYSRPAPMHPDCTAPDCDCEPGIECAARGATRGVAMGGAARPHAHHWRDFGQLGGRNVVWCSGCDSLAFAGQEPAGVAVPAPLSEVISDLLELHDSWLAGRLDPGSVCQGSAWERLRAAAAGVAPSHEAQGEKR